MRTLAPILLIATITAVLAGCSAATSTDVAGVGVGTSMGATTTTSAAPAIPMSAVTENQLRAEWRSQVLGDRARLTGTVYNTWIMYASDIVLLVDSLDSAGKIVAQTQARLWRTVAPGSDSYFDLTLPAAASYRVQIVGVRWLSDQRS